MEKTFALIKGATVVNSIVADYSYIEFIKNDYTNIVETTDVNPTPSAGATYDKDTDTFSYPVPFVVESIPD
jgi:hypothetical protein